SIRNRTTGIGHQSVASSSPRAIWPPSPCRPRAAPWNRIVQPGNSRSHPAGAATPPAPFGGRVAPIATRPRSRTRDTSSATAMSRCITKSSSMGRFTPETTTRPEPWWHRRRATNAQLPLWRSVNRIARRPWASSVIFAAIASGESPRLLSGTSASAASPAIWRTASTRPWASSPWATMIPMVSRRSFIVFLEVLLHGPHRLLEPAVEQLRRVHARVLQELVHGHDLGDDRDVLPRVQRNPDLGHLHPEDLDLLPLQPRPVVVRPVVPVFELHHHLDPLLLADGADAEERADVDDPDPADLHVVPLELVAGADEDVVAAPRNVHQVVRHEAMPEIGRAEYALALPDAAPADEQEADTVDVREGPVHGRARRHAFLEKRLDAPEQLPGLEGRPQDRDPSLPCQVDHDLRHLLPLADHDPRDVEREEELQRGAQLLRRLRQEVAHLGLAEELEAPAREAFGEAGEHQARVGDVRAPDLACEADAVGEQLQSEPIASTLVEVFDRD